MGKLTPERAISLVLLCTLPSCALPLLNSESRLKVICQKTIRFIGWVNQFILAAFLMHTSYNYADQASLVIPSVLLGCVCFTGNVQTIICFHYSNRLQVIITELQRYCKSNEPLIKKTIEAYMDRYATFYGVFMFWVYFTSIPFLFGPFLRDELLPTQAEYPLQMEDPHIWSFLYFHQCFASILCSAQICLSAVWALFYWYIIARFEILAEKFRLAENVSDLKECIKEHQYLLWLTQEIITTSRLNVLAELIYGTVAIVFSALYITRPQPMEVRAQYMVVNSMTLYSSFAVIWPADSLLSLNDYIRRACYESKWFEQSSLMRQNLMIIMLRCQRKMCLSVGFILPEASLEFYRKYVSTAASYFTVLHIVFDEESP